MKTAAPPLFADKESLMAALAPLDAAGRAEILYSGRNRALAVNTGSNVTLYTGGTLDAARVLVIHRRNRHTGAPDGLGTLGGMAERTWMSAGRFAGLPPAEQAALAKKHDDIARDGAGGWTLLTDEREIAERNAAREVREELRDIGIDAEKFPLDFSGMESVTPPGIRDDNYILRVWRGDLQPGHEVFAAAPLCYIMPLESGLFDALTSAPQSIKPDSELFMLGAMTLRDTLGRWGRKAAAGEPALEDGRHAAADFRYPHEWLNNWAVAAKLLDRDPSALTALAGEVQAETPHRIDFGKAAGKLSVILESFDAGLGVPPGTVAAMQAAIDHAMDQRRQPQPLRTVLIRRFCCE